MTHKERFRAVFSGEKPDRLPIYYFGTWAETKRRWASEGLASNRLDGDPGPQLPGMDPDWEDGLWDCHGLANPSPIGDFKEEVLERGDDYEIRQTSLGAIERVTLLGASIPLAVRHCLEPTRESWERFKTFLNPDDPRRRPDGWRERAAKLAQEDALLCFMGGSMYGWLRNFMGVEAISCLMYDDPELLSEMVGHLTDFFMAVYGPVLKAARFDLAYFFEDCCGSTGPLFSPRAYSEFFDGSYRRLIRFYKENGVGFTLLDSDGQVGQLIPGWLASGIDIIFPVEAGVWGDTPASLRGRFGAGLKMMGGVNKHVIPLGEDAIRQHLLELKPAVEQGGYLPIPDHRIPPECSYADILAYVRVFGEVFGQ
jgi:uroporphyrinogen decarboxylase